MNMQSGDCILVFGVSGVGKTSSCRAFVARHPEFLYFRASSLLSQALAATPEQLRTSDGHQIESNQRLLGDQLRLRRVHSRNSPVLVDVHGVIDNDRELVQVPQETVASMEADGLVLLEARPEVVAARRLSDSRSRPDRPIEELSREIAAERSAVLHYAATLQLPVEIAQVVENFRIDPVIYTIRERIRRDTH